MVDNHENHNYSGGARKERQVEGYLSVRIENKKHGIYRVNGGKE